MAIIEVKIREVKAPCSGKIRGYRIAAAVYNRAAFAPDFSGEGKGEYVQSFAPKYLVDEYGDFESQSKAVAALPRTLSDLESRGHTISHIHG